MYCPQCVTAYRPGFAICADCGSPLVSGDPPSLHPKVIDGSAALVEVFVTSDPLHAELVAATLTEEGIESFVRTRFVGGLTLTPAETHWAPGQQRLVLVPALARDRALELVDSIATPLRPAEDAGPTDATLPVDKRRLMAKTVAIMVLAPVIVSLSYGAYLILGALRDPSQQTTAAPQVISLSPAVRALRHDCDAGDLGACVNLGVSYEKGEGVAGNPARAASLYRIGCEGGIPIGCINLGLNYENGSGVDVNPAEASRLYAKACEAGVMPGCYNLATTYQRGVGVPIDLPHAAQLFRQACYGGYSYSCVSLAYCYRTGSGLSQDAIEATRMYRRACDSGVMVGCYNLGVCYHTGEGVTKDTAEAARLYKRACEGGYTLGCNQPPA